jgi:hypothetical protein
MGIRSGLARLVPRFDCTNVNLPEWVMSPIPEGAAARCRRSVDRVFLLDQPETKDVGRRRDCLSERCLESSQCGLCDR